MEKKITTQKGTFNTKMYEVCSTDKARPIMNCVFFDNGFAYATNGHAAIKQSLDYQGVLNPENLDGKYLHRENYKAVMGFDYAACGDDGIECKNVSGAIAYFEYYVPGIEETRPDIEAAINTKHSLKQLSFIGINPDFLIKLTKALHAPGGNIRCQFTGIDTPIKVDVIGVDDQKAILMPYILTDTLF